MIDTHAHIDGEEFVGDLAETIERARAAGISRIFVPAVDLASVESVLRVASQYQGYALPMIGLHPEEVKADWREVLRKMHDILFFNLKLSHHPALPQLLVDASHSSDYPLPSFAPFIAIGEVGLDFYWSREFEKEQLEAFEQQVQWSVQTRLPLMIHCRKAQNELVQILRKYEPKLPGGVFHCFTGNAREAEELLSFERFCLGIGGVVTFKKSHLPEVLAEVVPLSRVVLETDSPYMAPVPHRGERNESAYVANVAERLAEAYGVDVATVSAVTDKNVERVFGVADNQ